MIELGLLVLTTPILQYLLINTNTGKLVYGGVPFALCFFAPFYFLKNDYHDLIKLKGLLLLIYLRMADISLLRTKIVQSWSLAEYYEYFFSSYTRDQRRQMEESTHIVPYSKLNAKYYAKLAWSLFIQYSLLNLLIWYGLTYPSDRDVSKTKFLMPYEFKAILDNLMYGLTVCLVLSISMLFTL